jgi:hypothetical protein
MMNLTKHIAQQNIQVANSTIAQVTQMAREGKFTGDQLVKVQSLHTITFMTSNEIT